MIYLLTSVVLFSINNVLWSIYAQRINTFELIRNRAVFTALLVGIIYLLAVSLYSLPIHSAVLVEVFYVSIVGFVGLYFLVLGFKYGTILQFSVYSLLTAFGIGIVSQYKNIMDLQHNVLSLAFIALGYLTFSYYQFYNTGDVKNQIKAHLYFILAHVFFGVLVFLQWTYLTKVSSIELAFLQEIVVLLLSSILVLKANSKKIVPIEFKLHWSQYLLLAVPISAAVLLNLQGLKATNPFFAALIGLLTPLLTVVIGVFITKETIKPLAILGFIIMFVGFCLFFI
jgi:drug/metabolite transporter (DMT)-like permease